MFSSIFHFNKYYAFLFFINILSIIGIPPLIGFIAKYYSLMLCFYNGSYIISYIGIFTSIISCYFYLNIIKYILFTDNIYSVNNSNVYFNSNFTAIYSALISTISIFVIFGFLYITNIQYFIHLINYNLFYLFIYHDN